MRVVPRVEDYPSRNIIQNVMFRDFFASTVLSSSKMQRQELRKQRIACIASRSVACSAERPRGQKTFRKE